MQLIYKNEQIELKRDASALTVIIEKVSELIKQKDIVFSHLIIDDIDVYENHEAYIKEKINEIMKIEIVTKTTKEMIIETMASVYEYLERAVPALEKLIDRSYQEFTDETWNEIAHLIDGIDWMLQFKTFVQKTPVQPVNWSEFEQTFETCENHIKELSQAMELKDTVLITDILAYEILPNYEVLLDNVSGMLQNKEFYKNVN